MNKSLPSLFILLFSITASASNFCERTQDEIAGKLAEESSRISFKNRGGLFNGGVCWWHSRMQRSSLYLAKFDEKGVKPGKKQLKEIIHGLKSMDKVVVIPGYKDFQSFSREHREEIQKSLEVWQRTDGFYNFEWIRGISGKSSLSPEEMEQRMNIIFKYYKSSPVPLWIMAQVRGITSHSYLILSMEEKAGGYNLQVIDSNRPLKTLNVDYYRGDRNLKTDGGKFTFVPYAGFQKDFLKMARALRRACPQKQPPMDLSGWTEGEIEKSYLQY